MRNKFFPIRSGQLDKSFLFFLLKGLANFAVPFLAYISFNLYDKNDYLKDFFFSISLSLIFFSIILWFITVRNLIRYTQFLYRYLKKNPLHNEKTPQFLAAGSLNEEYLLGEEPEFYMKKEEYHQNWKNLKQICICIVLFLPRYIRFLIKK
jgi:hypothetical protein